MYIYIASFAPELPKWSQSHSYTFVLEVVQILYSRQQLFKVNTYIPTILQQIELWNCSLSLSIVIYLIILLCI